MFINQTDFCFFFFWLSDGWHWRVWSTSVQAHILTGLPWCCFQNLSYQRNVWLWKWMMKKKLETVTVRSRSLLLISSFSLTRACGQHFLQYPFMGNLIYFCKWNFDFQLLVNKPIIFSLVIIEWRQTPVTLIEGGSLSIDIPVLVDSCKTFCLLNIHWKKISSC